eukprot:GHVS01028066.1.p1 GENE.GHVS01028066.1~~GHVS01028066.1.p1  ORF type:complete len:120 (+),score=6.42 GHVS01028066.1:294-653(+)
MDQFLVDRCPLILRIFTSCSALCFGASAITNFIISFRYLGYTPAIVNLIGFFFSVVALVCEFSPFGLNVLMAAVPCLGYLHTHALIMLAGFSHVRTCTLQLSHVRISHVSRCPVRRVQT